MERELSTPALLGTSLRMTIFSEVTISKIALIGIEGLGTENTCIRGVFVEGACAESLCVGGPSAVEHLETDSQSFWIMEIRLLGTWLEIGVGFCWLLLRLF